MRALRSTKLRKLPFIHVTILLLLSAAMAPAQPGDRRSPAEIRRALDEDLDQKTELIQQYPDQASSYLYRGEVYAALSRRPRDDNEREFFTDRALADFDMAIELNPNHDGAYAARARARQVTFLQDFDLILADYRTAARLIYKAEQRDRQYNRGSESRLPEIFRAISSHYLNRAEALVRTPLVLVELNLPSVDNAPWSDFDQAMSYAQKTGTKPYDYQNVVYILLRKGDVAFKARDYHLALEVYESDKKYLGEDYNLICQNEVSKEWCASIQRDLLLSFSIRRGRVFVKLHQPRRALEEFNVYVEKAPHLECSDIFQQRAMAYYQLGEDDLAAVEEKKVGVYPGACGGDIPK